MPHNARAMEQKTRGRLAAIVGRPNVGKSAIFNRLVGRGVAIVHPESGVTRDRLMGEAVWRDERFTLIDTGGVCNVDNARLTDEIQDGIRKQVDLALDEAAVALLVVDVEKGIMPMDREVARLLRAKGAKVLVAANKADNAAREAQAVEFESLGFPVYPVSALHDRGFDRLMPEVIACLPPAENVTAKAPLRVAIVGRPNVGKSSYINRLLRDERVIVSPLPGTTRDSVEVPFVIGHGEQARHYVLIDTAGMRPGRRPADAIETFGQVRAERSVRAADLVVLVLDTMQGPTQLDKKIGAMVSEHGKGCVLLVNKWDLSTVTEREYGPALLKAVPFLSHCPLVFASTKSGYNIRRSVDAIDQVAAQIRSVLPTGALNRAILDAYERTAPPTVGNRRLKILYSTQVGFAPIRIRLFVNDPKLVTPAYREYLVHTIRGKFGLEGAPVVLMFKERQNKKPDGTGHHDYRAETGQPTADGAAVSSDDSERVNEPRQSGRGGTRPPRNQKRRACP